MPGVQNVEAAVSKDSFFAGGLQPSNFLGDSLGGRYHGVPP
jgi:hypothetical protein